MPRFNLPRPRPTVAPRPTSTIAPKRPDPLPTKTPEVAKPPKTTIAPKRPDPPIVKPPKTTIAPKRPDSLPTKPEQTILTQSGNDWGTEDLDDYFGTDIMDMDPNSPEFAAAIQADTDAGPPTLPGEVDEQGWSSDFTDSGQQTSYDPEDTDEEETEEDGSAGSENALGQSLQSASRSSSVGGGYGKQRVAEQSRKQMNRTLGRSRSLLTT